MKDPHIASTFKSNQELPMIETDLSNLRDVPPFRGAVDTQVEGVIVGWCLLINKPSAAVAIDIFIGPLKVGRVTTGLERQDIVQAIKLPVKAGFEFPLSSINEAECNQALQIIAAAEVEHVPFESLMSFRIADYDLPLSIGPNFKFSCVQAAKIFRTLQQIKGTLDNLDKLPVYRGIVDGQNFGIISGWCIDGMNQRTSVALDIYFKDLYVGSTKTCDVRDDVSKHLMAPARPGFRFGPDAIASSALSDALKMLATCAEAGPKLDDFISVNVKGTKGKLPILKSLKFTKSDIDKMHDVLSARLEALSNNERIRVLDGLLVPTLNQPKKTDEDVRIVAFYLPQFHPFVENSEWWGEGFTEWTNVTTARPMYVGHDQPRIPADLGYYDLRIEATQEKQIDLAKQYGISAFCYYHYWFSGTTLMTLPIDRHIEKNYNIDFCVCWANENWSRRWDGSENDLLMSQQHSESDDMEYIKGIIKYFDNEHYIKIDGAPLLVVYRISLLSKPTQTIESWKEAVRSAGFPDLHVCIAETFGLDDPKPFGADSSCQFPPHGVTANAAKVEGLDSGHSGVIYDYRDMVANEIKRPAAEHLRFCTAMPSWDNTSRKGKTGNIFHHASPDLFEAWLSFLCAKAQRDQPPGKRLVFVNAWNEWGEGAYLEPDRTNGHRNLKAVRAALTIRNMLLGESLLPQNETHGPAFRQNVVEVVTTLVNANRQLLRFATDYFGSPAAGPSPFIARPKNAIREIHKPTVAQCHVETVDGHNMQRSEVTIIRSQRLNVRGWLRIPGLYIAQELPFFLYLVELFGGSDTREFVASIYEREQRLDVSNHFHEEGAYQWYGFKCFANFQAVEPGSYQLGLLVGSASDALAAHSVFSTIRIHVG